MDRGASSPFITELVKAANQPCYLFEFKFDSGTDRLTDAPRPVVWGGNLYQSTGKMLAFTGLEESSDMQIPNVTITVSGVDQAYVSLALNEPFLDRQLLIYKAFMDDTQTAISSPLVIFDGRMDTMVINDNPAGDSSIAISATNQWGDFERKPGRHTNSQEQQVYFPGDKFFDYVTQINRKLKWGSQ
ncbi:MAG: hypothetical protein CGW95_04775 [Phenylobacterium zucineum]|nr:MAG: hypothetical protein CGW95_04775 [Phenylobacterium zucineum]